MRLLQNIGYTACNDDIKYEQLLYLTIEKDT